MPKNQLHRLTARQVETLTAKGRHGDGGGLYLSISGDGRSWLFMYRSRGTGKRKEMGLGSAAKKGGITLALARDRAAAARAMLSMGKDPIAEKTAAKFEGATFGSFADTLLESIKPGFRGRNTANTWKRDLEIHCASLRSMACDDIKPADVLSVLNPLWLTRPKTARELRGRIERVLDAAESKGLRSGKNPAGWKGNLKELLPKQTKRKRGFKAAPYEDIKTIVRLLRARHQGADTNVNLAAEFVILTAARTGEARFMRVSEINWKDKIWVIPGDRMKMERDHEVPLSARALAILSEAVPSGTQAECYVFPGQWSKERRKPLGMNAIIHALQAVYPEMTTHGCRSSFRDWCGDETDFQRETAEAALAHKVGNEVEQAYRRRTALEKRRKLMNAWAEYLEGAIEVVDRGRRDKAELCEGIPFERRSCESA